MATKVASLISEVTDVIVNGKSVVKNKVAEFNAAGLLEPSDAIDISDGEIRVIYDDDYFYIDSEGQLAPKVVEIRPTKGIQLVDDELEVKVDGRTITFTEDGYLQSISEKTKVSGGTGIHIDTDSEDMNSISVDIDNDTIFINSEGLLEAKFQPIEVLTTEDIIRIWNEVVR